jgi:hypothetical protein
MSLIEEHKKIIIDIDEIDSQNLSVVKNDEWEVLTPSGWSDFSGIKKSVSKTIVSLQFSDGSELVAAPTHKVMLLSGQFISVIDLNVSDVLSANDKEVVSKQVIEVDTDLYDMLDVELNNEYYTNDIISHNCAFIRNFEEIWSSAYPTLSAGGKAILISTPAGVGNQYHKMWQEAEAGLNNFHPIKLAWDMHPDRDRDWFEKTLRTMSKKKFSREYLCVAGDSDVCVEGQTTKKASQLVEGDLVLTHTGNYKRVTKIRSRAIESDERLYDAYVDGKRVGALLTEDHPVATVGLDGETVFKSVRDIVDDIDVKCCFSEAMSVARAANVKFVDVTDENVGVLVYDIKVDIDKTFCVGGLVVHNCDFESSGDTFLNTDAMDWLKMNIKDPIEHHGYDRGMWVWVKPEYGKNYVLSADVSRGDSSDFSTFHVIDVATSEIVAEYMGKLPPDKFADFIREVANNYNRALVCPENNTFGYVTCMRLKELGYRRLYYSSAKGMNAFEYSPSDPYEVPGFTTQTKSRVQALSKMEEMFRNQALISHSSRLYSQLQTFVWVDGKATSQGSSHDDLVMSAAIGAWLVDVTCGTSKNAYDLSSTLIKMMSVSVKDVSAVNGAYNNVGPPQTPQARVFSGMFGAPRQQQNNVSDENRAITDLSWLL